MAAMATATSPPPQDAAAAFEQAAAYVRAGGLTRPMSDTDKLEMYALFKIATAGSSANQAEPSRLLFREHAKWEAWRRCEMQLAQGARRVGGAHREAAMRKYVAIVARRMREEEE